MAEGKRHLPPDLQRWVEARKRFRLSHAQVQMARELGMNPRQFGGLANADQEPWIAMPPPYHTSFRPGPPAAPGFWPTRGRMVRYKRRREHRVPTGPAPDRHPRRARSAPDPAGRAGRDRAEHDAGGVG